MQTAILIDGGFFLKRYQKVFQNGISHDAATKAENMYRMAHRHLKQKTCSPELYRILYYDCMPFTGTAHNPISKQLVDFGKTPLAKERLEFFEELKKRRKVALRLGELKASKSWVIDSRKTKDLVNGNLLVSNLHQNDIKYDLRQKGVDMKIGLDIAALALKRMVNQIILIAGDMDFVPAAKTARREGIDFILDPMWNPISPSLHEHIDGLCSTCENPTKPFPAGKYPYKL